MDTCVLVAHDGTIDYLCWPHLDSPTVFASLLDDADGGEFSILPDLPSARAVPFYLPDTNVLVTRWLDDSASADLTDCMPHPDTTDGPRRLVLRRLRALRGTMRFRVSCRPRFDYARATPAVRALELADGHAVDFTVDGHPTLRLTASCPLEVADGAATADLVLACGEEAWFRLCDPDEDDEDERPVAEIIDETSEAWRRWARRSTYRGRWREAVNRSALALKLLTSHVHGSIAAAATFGLPEATGAERNWDYRATWVRDASFTTYAFLRLGYVDEAEHFRTWMSERVRESDGSGILRIMYALDGSETDDETELDHLAGHGGARPVRIGNAAHHQTQLDIYGELMDNVYLTNKYGAALSHDAWVAISCLVEHVVEHWQDADAGIWEFRDDPRHLLHSRLMCWVAMDRALRLAHKRSLPAPVARWTEVRDAIRADIWANFRHPEHGHFVQEKGGTDLDAACLMMPLVRFVSATDPVWLATLDAIGDELVDGVLVDRYHVADGLEGGEGAFTTCTFWYVECLARAGRLDEAQQVMDAALSFGNRLGLFSEELDRRGLALGNFPQALTHLALISAAHFLNRRLQDPSGGEWQP